ncbi:uncharacterized protein LOC109537841 isoform X2 [Dendroctonus ponderosae]|uniref:uncharacterized protein LOC109537841 isoform X2 n=1 Tax=Dendroctonus ponderosae TaxID=77166 RepID=UPI002034E810|nr:uncharacterized protein LOC109537841 isoform X2 [Dendroctonus ponderosae]
MPLHLEHGLALLLRSFNINNRLCDGSAWHVPERRPPSPAAMVKTFQAYLPPQCHRTYSCIHCRAHLANHDELISKVTPPNVDFSKTFFYQKTCCHSKVRRVGRIYLIP